MPWDNAASGCLGTGQVPSAIVWALPDWGHMQVLGLCVAVAVNWLVHIQAGRCQVGPGDAHPWFSVLEGLGVKRLALGAYYRYMRSDN